MLSIVQTQVLVLAAVCTPQSSGPISEVAACDEEVPWQACQSEFIYQPGIGIGFTGICYTGISVPDPHIAAGPSHLVAVTNGAIAFFEKDGAIQFLDDIGGPQGFWSNVGASTAIGAVVDPRVIFDPSSGRYFASAIDHPGTASSFVLLAVSDDADPCGTWHKYRFDTTGLAGPLFDQQHIGVTPTAVSLGGIAFPMGQNAGFALYSFQKQSILNGGPAILGSALLIDLPAETAGLVPVSHGASSVFLVSDTSGTDGLSVALIALQNVLGPTPTVSSVEVPVEAYALPPCQSIPLPLVIPQKGTNLTINAATIGNSFMSVASRNGSIWAAHYVYEESSSRVLSRWYEFRTNGWPDLAAAPALRQWGTIDFGAETATHTFHPSIAVDEEGNAAMVFCRSSGTEYLSIWTAFRLADEPLGVMHIAARRRSGTSALTSFSQCPRLGDYSGISEDPSGTLCFWSHHHYIVGPGEWRTWIASQCLTGSSAAYASASPSDLTGDGVIDVLDLGLVMYSWSEGNGLDLSGNAVIDGADLGMVLDEWAGVLQ